MERIEIRFNESKEEKAIRSLVQLVLSFCKTVTCAAVKKLPILKKGIREVAHRCRASASPHYEEVYRSCFPDPQHPSAFSPDHTDCRWMQAILENLNHPDPRCVFSALIVGIYASFGPKFLIERYQEIMQETKEYEKKKSTIELKLHFALTPSELNHLLSKELDHTTCQKRTKKDPILRDFRLPDPPIPLQEEKTEELTASELENRYYIHLVRCIRNSSTAFLHQVPIGHQTLKETKKKLHQLMISYLNEEWILYGRWILEEEPPPNSEIDFLFSVRGLEHENPKCVFQAVYKTWKVALLGNLSWTSSNLSKKKKRKKKKGGKSKAIKVTSVFLGCSEVELQTMIAKNLEHECETLTTTQMRDVMKKPLFDL